MKSPTWMGNNSNECCLGMEKCCTAVMTVAMVGNSDGAVQSV